MNRSLSRSALTVLISLPMFSACATIPVAPQAEVRVVSLRGLPVSSPTPSIVAAAPERPERANRFDSDWLTARGRR